MREIAFVSYLALTLTACQVTPEAAPEPRVILVTLDGLRWEDVFTGLDSTLSRHTETFGPLSEDFWTPDLDKRKRLLMPWLWETVGERGILLGNRALGSDGIITNGRNFSYPSYNELLSGQPDDRIDSNDKIPNPNVSVLEWLNKRT